MEEIIENKYVIPILEKSIGLAVADNFQANSKIGELVKCHFYVEGIMSESDHDKLFLELRDRRIVLGEQDDEIIWCVASLGEYC